MRRLTDSTRGAPFGTEITSVVDIVNGTDDGSSLEELNLALIDWIFTKFSVCTPRIDSSQLGVTSTKSRLILDICLRLSASTYISGPSGREYLDLNSFRSEGIDVEFFDFIHPTYPKPGLFHPFMSSLEAVAFVPADARKALITSFSLSSF